MLYNLIKSYRTISIVGMCKNAGKTTVLGSAIGEISGMGYNMAITSIGRDGEVKDLVTGTEKPRIFVPPDTLIATASGLLPLCDTTNEVLVTTGINTPMGEIVMLRTRSAGFVQIAGPSIVSQLVSVRDLFINYGADYVLLDGAVSRKSLGSRQAADGVIVCTGASYGRDVETVTQDTAFLAEIMTLPRTDDIPQNGPDRLAENQAAFFSGAMTETVLKPLLLSGKLDGARLVADDPSKIMLSKSFYNKLRLRKVTIEVRDRAELIAVAINPVSAYGWVFEAERFAEKLRRLVKVPVINVKEVRSGDKG